MRNPKKIQIRNRLKLELEIIRTLSTADLKRIAGGNETHDRSDACSQCWPCNTGPQC
jgi:hypothetical protein